MKTLLANQFRKTGLRASGYMGLFGFISDILQPIAPFSGYLFFISAFMVVFILIVMVVKSALQEKMAPALIVSITLFIVSGLFFALQGGTEKDSKDYGVLASQIPAIKTLQSSLGLIQEDVAAIRTSTENIDQTTARTEQVVKQVEINTRETTEATKKVAEAVEESTKQIVGSLEEIQKGFTSLTQAGGVIPNPTRPEQFYHNARIQELGGDYGNARQSYNKYFSFKLDFLDPHLRYQSFLKVQEGRAGARETYSYLYENDPRPIVEYARILLFDAPERTQMLEDFIESNPDFAPAYYELSREYSQARKGTQSLSDKKAEYKALEQFEVLNKEGKLFRYFVDKEIVSKWVIDSEERFRLLSIIAKTFSSPPVTISATSSSSSEYTSRWTVKINISEVAREIRYSIDNVTNYKSTGMTASIDPATGAQKPVFSFLLPGSTKNATIFVKYLDINNIEQGPYLINFNAFTESVEAAKNIRPDNWIEYEVPYKTLGGPVVFADLSRLIKMRCGISKIFYGVDRLDTNWQIPLEKCRYNNTDELSFREEQASGISAGGAGSSYIRFVVIELEYRDGTTSEIHKFPSPYAHLYEEPLTDDQICKEMATCHPDVIVWSEFKKRGITCPEYSCEVRTLPPKPPVVYLD